MSIIPSMQCQVKSSEVIKKATWNTRGNANQKLLKTDTSDFTPNRIDMKVVMRKNGNNQDDHVIHVSYENCDRSTA